MTKKLSTVGSETFFACNISEAISVLSEWYWRCVLSSYVNKVLAVLAGTLSVAVVWSEVTFFNKDPVLSIFAVLVEISTKSYNYFAIEVSCVLFIKLRKRHCGTVKMLSRFCRQLLFYTYVIALTRPS